MKNTFFSIIIFTNLQIANAEDLTINCFAGVGETIDKANSALAGCEAARIALKSDIKADEVYRRKLNSKLAQSVITQTKQIMQDLGASSGFYEQNGQSFLLGTEVAKSCRFDFLKEYEKNGCHGKITKEEKDKIALLHEAISEGEGVKSQSLSDGIMQIYGINKYGRAYEANQCPMDKTSFPAESQLTDDAVESIFNAFNSSDEDKISKEAIFKLYPQLALVFHANKSSPDFLSKFEDYMNNYKDSGKTKKEYLLNFLFDEKNKKVISSGVSQRCNQVRNNLTTFICSPLQTIAPEDPKVAKILFDDYNIKKEYQDQKKDVRANPDSYRTYGYLCESKASVLEVQSRNNSVNIVKNNTSDLGECFNLPSNSNVDAWYKCFNQDIRTEKAKEIDALVIKQFCDKWSCKDEAVSKTSSCKAGGPLTSKDLISLKIDDKNVYGQIAFLQMLESQKEIRNKFLALDRGTQNSNEEVTKALGLSEFDLNAFGAEAVMKFVGIPSTPVTLALVSQEMNDKGIKSSTQEEIREIVTRATNLAPKVASNSSDDDFNMTPTVASTPAVASASNWKNTNYIKPEPSPIAKTKHKIVEAPSKRNPEVQQMMDDLQEIMKAGKDTSTTDDGDEAASTSFSGGASASANSKKQAKTIQGLTSSDLETWAQKLKAKETTLNFRETLADQRDAEYWRNKALSEGGEKEKGRSIASVDEKDSQARSGSNGQASLSSSDYAKGKSKAELAAEVSASSTGLIVTPEKLDKLEKMDLKNFGVNIEEPFVISVRMNGKLIHVRVAKVEMKGREFLAPRLTDDNKEAKEVILNSPLFKEFRYFYEKENSSYFPVKSANN